MAADAGFDIYSTVRTGTTVDLMALATIRAGNQYGLNRISLYNGRADRVAASTATSPTSPSRSTNSEAT